MDGERVVQSIRTAPMLDVRNVSDVAGFSRLIGLGLDDFPAPVISIGRHVMAKMNFTTGRLDGKGRIGEEIVGTMHPALGG